ncbi:hypothetical protein POM88_020116 [Heracleum sosnowskyi]|uniref:Uncharacterized protein n=1 Tax=Heracleum sosnowskyi TaxID=360622 RepID=A0AAD8MR58_9APIA|nr:hypothetical protein POM88_020116 [Heracleum sosnowskyi]
MGRAIVRNNSPDPGKHSRLWVSNDICDVLKKQKGTEEIEEFPDWISQSNDLGSTVSLNLPSQVLHDFLAIIVCFKHWDNNSYRIDCSLKNATSGFVWSHNLYTLDCNESWMVIVPRSIFPVIDGNNRIELRTTNADVLGHHLLHSTTVTVEDERSCPSKRLKHLESDEKSYPSKRLKHLESDD